MQRLYILLTLFASLAMSSIFCRQQFEPSSFWELLAQNQYIRGDDSSNRFSRALLFIEDTKRWENQNKFIPEHRFSTNPSQLRIVTYNVRYWTNARSEHTRDEILKVIAYLNPDILILQEAEFDARDCSDWSDDQLIAAFRSLGYAYGGLDTLCTIWSARNTRYGTVIFSKFPLKDITVRRFVSTALCAENQGYVHAHVQVSNTTLSVYGTHLAAESTPTLLVTAEATRRSQLQQLANLIESDYCDNAFIAADCNAVRKKDFDYQVNGVDAWQLADRDYLELIRKFPRV